MRSEGLSYLKEFSARAGHCRVSAKHKTDDGYRLGNWVSSQRANNDTIDPDRRRRLEELPGWLLKVKSDV